ncbi:hypothetical protein [Micromonospora sp. NBRC 110038]|uniref:hypothetical protein n=1 Tax=Micromonospora sp. NBRC 110038 TaxID=1550034 RepID=UPI001E543A5C|nr:hypothetical protein [Micromonospora sp. NBRC 110038]
MPSNELRVFGENLTFARDLVATANVLAAQTTAAIKTDDLLRSALVQGVSAFDHYVHEEVKARMLLTQQGLHPRAAGFDRFRVSLSSVDIALRSATTAWLEVEIREQHGYLAFQQPDKVADAFRLVTDVKLWPAVAAHLSRPADELKRQLKLVVERRNTIVHEADMDPTPPRTRYPINGGMVTLSLDFLEELVLAFSVVT